MLLSRKRINLIIGGASIALMQLTGGVTYTHNPAFIHSSIDLGFNLPALASETDLNYQPPDRGAPRQTQSTGSRGCTDSLPVAVTLLVPNNHTGLTISGHPTFYWYMSAKTSMPIEVSLVEPGVAKPVFVKQIEVKEPGIVAMQMPPELPEVMPGRTYRWSVATICNENQRSQDIFVQAWIERISTQATLGQKLAQTNSDEQRARIYAAAGLWYDALNAISAAIVAEPNNLDFQKKRLDLLDQVGLIQVAK